MTDLNMYILSFNLNNLKTYRIFPFSYVYICVFILYLCCTFDVSGLKVENNTRNKY